MTLISRDFKYGYQSYFDKVMNENQNKGISPTNQKIKLSG